MGRRGVAAIVLGHAAWLLGAITAGDGRLWLTMGLAAAATCAVVLLATRFSLDDLARPRDLVIGAAAGLALAVVSHVGVEVTGPLLPGLQSEIGDLYARVWSPPGPVVAFPVLAFIIVVEELLWRGLLHRALSARLSGPLAVLVGSGVYALGQAGQGSAWLVALALGVGLVFATLRLLTGRLGASIACHLVWDAIILIGAPLVDVAKSAPS